MLQDYEMNVYLQQEWVDVRLQHNAGERILIRDKVLYESLWHSNVR